MIRLCYHKQVLGIQALDLEPGRIWVTLAGVLKELKLAGLWLMKKGRNEVPCRNHSVRTTTRHLSSEPCRCVSRRCILIKGGGRLL